MDNARGAWDLSARAGSSASDPRSPAANIFLHEVLDVWFEREVRQRMRRRAHLVRYADDAVLLFEYEEDARRVMMCRQSDLASTALHRIRTRQGSWFSSGPTG